MADKIKKIEQVGEMRFSLDDWREDQYNESADLTYALYGDGTEVMPMETYWMFCRQFAAAIGFGEDTIREYFGG